ncbi:hypothetical protein SODALDRAFT_327846 [Sodiomyces alkalinus F11]|uniref:BRCT domain-containing protein n=1 Tax=Sodiomyces alkalinus (strain CBS 110278 / VKM F-3762 / F11) TaxID=1314773 RepID=A0A3N2QA63_SODAK|nr:hypothetical protein SODALDRAFT_327846 [Sodiomyces alkalinus F11]ROT43640.1 hypothetical protein SODALDRAFT_327846 [Sodiomyces alkalinus F11]
MDPQSPPKRMTRARAAAKAGETGSSKTSRVTTAASRAKAAASAGPVSNKRKTRSDDCEVEPQNKGRQRQQLRHEEEEEHNEATQRPESATRLTRATRGRPRKNPEPATAESSSSSATATATATTTSTSTSATAPTRAPRARAATRKTVVEPPRPESVKVEPSKPTTRGRPKKTPVSEDAPTSTAPDPPKKATTRSRTTVSSTATTMSATTTKEKVKKKVTFEAPEKENVDPDASKKSASADKAPAATGLRARPVRKAPLPRAALAATRAGSTSTSTSAAGPAREPKAPLSPKKVTQVPYSRDDSEDELTTMEKAPVRSMVKDPVKPPASALSSFRKPNLRLEQPDSVPEKPRSVDEKGEEEQEQEQEEEGLPRNALTSPARRLATSPSKEKESMKSPAKRGEGLTLPKLSSASAANPSSDAHATPFKSSLLNTPAKRPQSALKGFHLNLPSASRSASDENVSARNPSFLKSPAKRPHMSILPRPSPTPEEPVVEETSSAVNNALPAVVAEPSVEMSESPSEKPTALTSSEKLMIEEHSEEAMNQLADELDLREPLTLHFPGRLSAVLPRHADPALKDRPAILHEQFEGRAAQSAAPSPEPLQISYQEPSSAEVVDVVDPMVVDESDSPSQTASQPADSTTTPSAALSRSPPKGAFGLRQRDREPYHDLDSEPEDDDATCKLRMNHLASTTPATRSSRRSLASSARVPTAGFTPLAQQLSAWSTASPVKTTKQSVTPGGFASHGSRPKSPELEVTSDVEPSPVKSTFFEDEMTVRAESEAQESLNAAIDAVDAIDAGLMSGTEEPEFDDIMVTDEDMELAAEADEMSLLEPEQVYHGANTKSFDDSLSDASQEYGDENEMPVDPALARADTRPSVSIPPNTPMRTLHREFHTVSKVPLKPADDSTPRPRRKRAASISRLPVSRPTQGLTRSATVISYSPMKNNKIDDGQEDPGSGGRGTSAPATPTKSEAAWSNMGTPARTPRRDLNPSLLSGAVVFVDVHTSEGADASCIFVDLLNQMGARCVKNWAWNPDGTGGSDKVGITHVVYKDGGKRTLEKIRETRGLVQCVGVSWVLDCERENKWLDEQPYYIDTSLTPRGGARRRKTMEPRALEKMNGMLASGSPTKGRRRHTQTAPNTPMNRRDSTEWMHTPSDRAEEGDDDDDDHWQALLTPVPVTPAPDALARYAAELTPETPTMAFDFDDSPSKKAGLMTCPSKPSTYSEMGRGILDREKDESVLMRLMAARRKSLQFAPKVSSPLSKAW